MPAVVLDCIRDAALYCVMAFVVSAIVVAIVAGWQYVRTDTIVPNKLWQTTIRILDNLKPRRGRQHVALKRRPRDPIQLAKHDGFIRLISLRSTRDLEQRKCRQLHV